VAKSAGKSLEVALRDFVYPITFEPSVESLVALDRRNDPLLDPEQSLLVFDYPARGVCLEFKANGSKLQRVAVMRLFGLQSPHLSIPKEFSRVEFLAFFDKYSIKLSPKAGYPLSFDAPPPQEQLDKMSGVFTASEHHHGLIEYVHFYVVNGKICGVNLSQGSELD
jgi:hypothetical protein